MILVDTSVWIDHFHVGDLLLTEWLHDGRVLLHPFSHNITASNRCARTMLAR